MWTVGIWIWLFFFSINIFIGYFDSVFAEYTLLSPFDTSTNITRADVVAIQPNVANATDQSGTLYENLTQSTQANATGGGTVGIWNIANYAWNTTIFFWDIISGGFMWQFLGLIGLPTDIITLFQGVTTMFLALTVIHLWRGIF